MSETNPEGREPDGVEAAQESRAGEARASGAEALREAMESPDHYRQGRDALEERDARFSQPRKEQGPPLEEAPEGESQARDDAADPVVETPPPEPHPDGDVVGDD